MSQPWSKPLEWLGRLRFNTSTWFKHRLAVGNPDAPDARGTTDWKRFVSGEALYMAWGPDAGSPWEPFHTVPLFAALDRIRPKEVGPAPPPAPGAGASAPGTVVLPEHARPGQKPPPWLDGETWTIVDLPGPASVAVGAWWAEAAQLVCTFDNWPHPKGVLRPEHTLAALLRYATTVDEARRWRPPGAPPVWLCDRDRLTGSPAHPGQFDNRYYLDDSILPGPALLRSNGIRRIVYVTTGEPLRLDLEEAFIGFRKDGVGLFTADLRVPGLPLVPYDPPPKARKRPGDPYRRSAAGGFGSEVPEPSSGSSG